MHEYYFDNLKSGGGTGDPDADRTFAKAAESSFGSYEIWKADFVGIGKMRGVGWAICYQNPANGRISNHWITLHETGNVAGFDPILVMDVWEHAYLLDYKPAERPKYIEAFFSNIDWTTVEKRLQKKTQRRGAPELKSGSSDGGRQERVQHGLAGSSTGEDFGLTDSFPAASAPDVLFAVYWPTTAQSTLTKQFFDFILIICSRRKS